MPTKEYFELHFYNICEFKWGKLFQEFILENLCRFLNVFQTPLDKDKVKPQLFLKTLNSVNEAVQFSMEFSNKKIYFLGFLITRDSKGIWMDLYNC